MTLGGYIYIGLTAYCLTFNRPSSFSHLATIGQSLREAGVESESHIGVSLTVCVSHEANLALAKDALSGHVGVLWLTSAPTDQSDRGNHHAAS